MTIFDLAMDIALIIFPIPIVWKAWYGSEKVRHSYLYLSPTHHPHILRQPLRDTLD